MNDGIYHVTFSSLRGSAGQGLVVVKDGSVNGGDPGYLYLGRLVADGNQLKGRLEIKRWNSSSQSIFGPLSDFGLELQGTVSGENFAVSGLYPLDLRRQRERPSVRPPAQDVPWRRR